MRLGYGSLASYTNSKLEIHLSQYRQAFFEGIFSFAPMAFENGHLVSNIFSKITRFRIILCFINPPSIFNHNTLTADYRLTNESKNSSYFGNISSERGGNVLEQHLATKSNFLFINIFIS